jgi:hypothetical protein
MFGFERVRHEQWWLLGERGMRQHGGREDLHVQLRLFRRWRDVFRRQRVPHEQWRLLGECGLREYCGREDLRV